MKRPPVVAPHPRLPQSRKCNESEHAHPTALYNAHRLLLIEESTGATCVRDLPLADYQYVRIIDIGTRTTLVWPRELAFVRSMGEWRTVARARR